MSDLTVVSLPYADDLIAHYQMFTDLPGFVLLESSDKQHGRYDIVTALPYDCFRVAADSPSFDNALSELQAKLPSALSSCNLPFQGGAIGYVAYDFGAQLAGVQSTAHPLNHMPLMDMKLYDWAIIADHKKKEVNFVAAHRDGKTAEIVEKMIQRWGRQPMSCQPFYLHNAFAPLISAQQYQEGFKAIHSELTRGRAYQVNYTQPFLAEYKGDPWDMYKQVRAKNPVPYSAFMRCEEGDLLSFSPERFLTMDSGVVSTSPIKGTSRRSSNPTEDKQLRQALLNSSKNRAENMMIVDLLRNDLGKGAKPGSVKVTSLCELQSFNSVHHLVSHIQAEYDSEVTPLDVFASCFPGGSITGAPKREAMRMIAEQEPYGRGVYCGSMAYFSAHGRFDSNIAIRTITAKPGTLYLQAGGGIVIDSQWEDEYRECFTKIAAIVNGF